MDTDTQENRLNIAYDFICQVKSDLKTKNRFSVDKRFDELIDLYVDEETNTQILKKGKRLYRARIYKEDDARDRFLMPPKGTRFKGHNAKNSFVNLKHEEICEGRCNPQFIPYLYASSSIDCCVYEMRPAKDTYISVANITVKEDLRILKLNEHGCFMADTGRTIIDDVMDVTMFFYLAHEFSRPHKAYGDYLLCQYVSERVKSYGFDGIAFNSAIYSGKSAINYVIFNYKKCKATSSTLRYISDVKIESCSNKDLSL